MKIVLKWKASLSFKCASETLSSFMLIPMRENCFLACVKVNYRLHAIWKLLAFLECSMHAIKINFWVNASAAIY